MATIAIAIIAIVVKIVPGVLMQKVMMALVLLVVFPAAVVAQDIFIPVDPPKATPSDWLPIIKEIGDWIFKIVVAVLAFLAQYRAGNATKKADEALEQSKNNQTNITEGRKEAKEDVSTQTVAIKLATVEQTKDLLAAKIAEKPAVVVPVPTIPPVE